MNHRFSCTQCRDLLPAYIAGRLSAIERASIEQHIPTCPECQRDLEYARKLHEMFLEASEHISIATPATSGWDNIAAKLDTSSHHHIKEVTLPMLYESSQSDSPVSEGHDIKATSRWQRRGGFPLIAAIVALVIISGFIWYAMMPKFRSHPFLATGTEAGSPDSVIIQTNNLVSPNSPTPAQTTVTLTDTMQVHNLYTMIYSLPTMPEKIACTDELGPSYTLTFKQGTTQLVQFNAERYGCHPISVVGKNEVRKTTTDFWNQLDLAINEASPIADVQWVAVKHRIAIDHPPQIAKVSSVEATQHLYQSILALPLTAQSVTGFGSNSIEYELAFHTKDQVVLSLVDLSNNLISLEGNHLSRTGTYVMNDNFKGQFSTFLAETAFASASPDTAQITVQPNKGSASSPKAIVDKALIQQLYSQTLALPQSQLQSAGCPSGSDKESGTGTWYFVTFTQWDLPLLNIQAYEGSCMSISIVPDAFYPMNTLLQGNQAFWDLIHHAASPQ
jgi:Putative zinc-finger